MSNTDEKSTEQPHLYPWRTDEYAGPTREAAINLEQRPTPETDRPYSYLRWHRLSEISEAGRTVELMASTSDEGIGIIAKWTRIDDDDWKVEAIDTEGRVWEQIVDFHEGECVPPTPPAIWTDTLERQRDEARKDAALNAKAHDAAVIAFREADDALREARAQRDEAVALLKPYVAMTGTYGQRMLAKEFLARIGKGGV